MAMVDPEVLLETSKERLQAILSQRKSLDAEEMQVRSVINGCEAIIFMQQQQSTRITLTPTQPTALPSIPEVAGVINDGDADEAGENKTQFVRDQILASGTNGITSADLKMAAKRVGMKHPPSWPYGPLQRLKKTGEIMKRKGRFYPKGVAQPNLSLAG